MIETQDAPAPPSPAADADIGIAVCTYNGARFLREQLDSLLAQTRRPAQIVISDDASSDDTPAILQDFAARAGQAGIRVQVIRNAINLGYVKNFESALRQIDTELVFLCDQDDVWHPTKLETYARVFAQRPGLRLLHSDARLVDAAGADLGTTLFDAIEMTPAERAAEHAGQAFAQLLRRNLVTGATAAFRRGVLAAALPIPDGWIHDEWIGLVAAAQGEVDCLEDKFIDYRQHGGNQIGAQRRGWKERMLPTRLSRRAFIASKAARLARLEQQLMARLGSISPANAQSLSECGEHNRFRADLPERWFPRWQSAWLQWRAGYYGKYSTGLRSFVSDVLALQ